ncbi:MAG: NUDIX domain-containing protein [Candidatus Cyclonatronum sp.]|uniref:NUDIX domain-containing protein n=1 Tax=Cyclonatronum sp. TaxID=3024185 RepID=UPI0025C4C6D5|nr:NUDIX domain-containing protein [Cyclonatronum sp.]MCH8485413.1 NUDIX domain-containing protein [Cyclonatronum sp.]
MPDTRFTAPSLIDVYPYRMSCGAVHFMMFRRAKGTLYEGQWRMIGGKVMAGETAAAAAQREFKEETSLDAELFWCVPSVNSFFDFERNMLHHIPVFACSCKTEAKPVLNHEHDSYGWFTAAEAAKLTAWPEQQRLIRLIERILLHQDSLPNEWILSRP